MLDGGVDELVLGDQGKPGELGGPYAGRQVIAAAEVGHRHVAAREGVLQQLADIVLQRHGRRLAAAWARSIRLPGDGVEYKHNPLRAEEAHQPCSTTWCSSLSRWHSASRLRR